MTRRRKHINETLVESKSQPVLVDTRPKGQGSSDLSDDLFPLNGGKPNAAFTPDRWYTPVLEPCKCTCRNCTLLGHKTLPNYCVLIQMDESPFERIHFVWHKRLRFVNPIRSLFRYLLRL